MPQHPRDQPRGAIETVVGAADERRFLPIRGRAASAARVAGALAGELPPAATPLRPAAAAAPRLFAAPRDPEPEAWFQRLLLGARMGPLAREPG